MVRSSSLSAANVHHPAFGHGVGEHAVGIGFDYLGNHRAGFNVLLLSNLKFSAENVDILVLRDEAFIKVPI